MKDEETAEKPGRIKRDIKNTAGIKEELLLIRYEKNSILPNIIGCMI
jgi:hypothetical protein